jgi:hypothetical protein
MNIEFEKTGKTYPVTIDELVAHTKTKLAEYDELVKRTGAFPVKSPYTDPIIYTTSEGKLVQVPDYIQQEAITEYKSSFNFKDPIPDQFYTEPGLNTYPQQNNSQEYDHNDPSYDIPLNDQQNDEQDYNIHNNFTNKNNITINTDNVSKHRDNTSPNITNPSNGLGLDSDNDRKYGYKLLLFIIIIMMLIYYFMY